MRLPPSASADGVVQTANEASSPADAAVNEVSQNVQRASDFAQSLQELVGESDVGRGDLGGESGASSTTSATDAAVPESAPVGSESARTD